MTDGGKKFDDGKPPLSMIPRSAIEAEAQVLAFGAKKYGRDNWREGFDWTRLADAVLRHVEDWLSGVDQDPESGLSPLAHARCGLGFLIEHQHASLGTDDRFVYPEPEAKKPGHAGGVEIIE